MVIGFGHLLLTLNGQPQFMIKSYIILVTSESAKCQTNVHLAKWIDVTVAPCASGLIPPYLDNNYKWRAAETFDSSFLPGAHPTLSGHRDLP